MNRDRLQGNERWTPQASDSREVEIIAYVVLQAVVLTEGGETFSHKW